jgi:hypothetical protein
VGVLFPTLLYEVNNICQLLHCAGLGYVADISDVYAASIFRHKVCKGHEFLCMYRNEPM